MYKFPPDIYSAISPNFNFCFSKMRMSGSTESDHLENAETFGSRIYF